MFKLLTFDPFEKFVAFSAENQYFSEFRFLVEHWVSIVNLYVFIQDKLLVVSFAHGTREEQNSLEVGI